MSTQSDKPLVYSCSGCSNLAQIAHDMALSLNASGAAEMSCIAGVGGNVEQLVTKAKSGRKIIAIDGCPNNCVKSCLAQRDLEPDFHFELTAMGMKKAGEGINSLATSSKILKTIHLACGLKQKASAPFLDSLKM